MLLTRARLATGIWLGGSVVGERGMMLPGFCADVRVMRGGCSREDLGGAGIALIGCAEHPDMKVDKLLHFTSVKTFVRVVSANSEIL